MSSIARWEGICALQRHHINENPGKHIDAKSCNKLPNRKVASIDHNPGVYINIQLRSYTQLNLNN